MIAIVDIAPPSPELVMRFDRDLAAAIGDGPGRLGVAVSGGPDSLALLLLASTARPGEVEAATVDHGLRAASTAEAEFVAGLCRALGIPHTILKPATRIEGSLQAEARRARYALLDAWRADRGLDWILTAHHADDQAETLLMRLNRGAGVGGLSGIRAANGRVVRPLLQWRRSTLTELVRAAGIEAIADPSNQDERFDRARLRRQLSEIDWIEPVALARSAQALADAQGAIEWMVDQLAEQRVTRRAGEVVLDPTGLPTELRRRLLLRLLREIDPQAEPRGEALTRLLRILDGGGTATLAGVKVRGGPEWRLQPAPPRRGSGIG